MRVLAIGAAAHRAMLDHATGALPREAVGLLAGRRGDLDAVAAVATEHHPLVNLGGSRSFFADPYSQYLAERSIADAGLELVAIYHSHPEGSAALSPDDVAFARLRPEVVQVVVATRSSGGGAVVRGYLPNGPDGPDSPDGGTCEVRIVAQ